MERPLVGFALCFLIIVALACGEKKEPEAQSTNTRAEQEQAEAPDLIKPLQPAKFDMDKALLGRRLYHDNMLSGDGTLSCATCHNVAEGGAESRRVSIGIVGQQGPINAPTVLNAALNIAQFWDGRAKDLAEQAEGPVANPIEMGATWTDVEKKVSTDKWYGEQFKKLYDGKASVKAIANAIAEYETSLVTPSRFDKYLRGDKSALTDAEKVGYKLFKETGCQTCHLGENAGGGMYQKMGLVKDYFKDRGNITEADYGRFNHTKNEADKYFFKVPTLRNVELTGPYLHDGSHDSLEKTVKTMGKYQLGKSLTDEEAASIATFLKTLTGKLPEHALLPEGELPQERLAPEPPASKKMPAPGEGSDAKEIAPVEHAPPAPEPTKGN